MDKIIKALLSEKFKGLDVDSLLEVINNTTNPQIATEIVCGLYEAPVFFKNEKRVSKHNGTLTFLSYDKWSNRVEYKYTAEESKGVYVSKDTDPKLVTIENYKDYEISKGNSQDGSWIYVKTGKSVDRTDVMYLENWCGLPFPEGFAAE